MILLGYENPPMGILQGVEGQEGAFQAGWNCPDPVEPCCCC